MAGVDKIYVNNWKDFCEVRDYFTNTKFPANNGTWCVLKNYMYDVEHVTEDTFDGEKEVAVTNTPKEVDYLLWKHCQIKVIRDYVEDLIDDDDVNIYENFYRDPGTKIKIIERPKFGNINKALNQRFGWWVNVYTPRRDEELGFDYKDYPTYYKDTNQWLYDYELEFPVNDSWSSCRYKTIKSLIRNIRKWKLPKGTIVEAQGRYKGEIYKFLIK